MEEMLVTYQDALQALSEMQETLDAIDSNEISSEAFRHLIETYKEASPLFLNFLAEYMENVCETPVGSHKPTDILATAQREKIITGKEFKHLSGQVGNASLHAIPDTDEDAQQMIETFASLHDTMRGILEEIEL